MWCSRWHTHNYHTMYFYLEDTLWHPNSENTFPFTLNPLSVIYIPLEGEGECEWDSLHDYDFSVHCGFQQPNRSAMTDVPWMNASWGFPPIAVYSSVVCVHIMWYTYCTVLVRCIHWTWVVIERKRSKGQLMGHFDHDGLRQSWKYFVSDNDDLSCYWATCSKEEQLVGHFDQGSLCQSHYSFVTDKEPHGWNISPIVHLCYVIAQ